MQDRSKQLVGESPPWLSALEHASRVAPLDRSVLVIGERGTGKELVGERLHFLSKRWEGPFVKVNCAAMTETLLDSELFGHERGAFTDAKRAKRGLLEVAATGSAFLDEVGETALDVQPKLLKAIEERTFRRLGGTAELTLDARLIAATNRPLSDAVRDGRFRADLFYRLQVLTISLPPLRSEPERIPELAHTLLPRGARLTLAALRTIEEYPWPGNIRELKNSLWRAAILAEGAEIDPVHLSLPIEVAGDGPRPGALSLAETERRAIESALRQTGGNKARAALLLGIARSTLNEKLKRVEEKRV